MQASKASVKESVTNTEVLSGHVINRPGWYIIWILHQILRCVLSVAESMTERDYEAFLRMTTRVPVMTSRLQHNSESQGWEPYY